MSATKHDDTFAGIESADLRVIDALNRTGSLTAAASNLGLSQPALSQRIKRVETRLGVPVVERSGRGIRLTPAGRVLATHATVVLAELDAALTAIEDLRGDRSGALRLVGFPSASATIVPKMMALAKKKAPDITFEYLEAEPPEAAILLREGVVDAALIFEYPGAPERPAGTTFKPLWREELNLIVGNDHHDLRDTVKLSDFRDADWIAGCEKCRGYLLSAANYSGFTPIIIQETDNIPAMMAMAVAGGAVALVPGLSLAAAKLPEGAGAHKINPPSYRTIGLLSISTHTENPAVRFARKLLAEIDGACWSLESV